MLLPLCFVFVCIFCVNYKRAARYSLIFITMLISKLIFKSLSRLKYQHHKS